MLELAFGYNGTERLLGQTTGLSHGSMTGGKSVMQEGMGMQPPGTNSPAMGGSAPQGKTGRFKCPGSHPDRTRPHRKEAELLRHKTAAHKAPAAAKA